MADPACVLYVSGTLPTRSETFVYREIFALRRLGVTVRTASVHAPSRNLGDPSLEDLAEETIPIYPSGVMAIVKDTVAEFLRNPAATMRTYGRTIGDALFSGDVRHGRRVKVLWQGLAAIALARRARRIGVSHIHAHMAHVPTTIAMYSARHLGIPFSFTGHANDLFPNRTLLAEKLRRAAWVNCISEWHRDFYRSIESRGDEDYPIVRCGVDTNTVRSVDPPSGATLEVLGVGRLVEKKGFDALIKAIGRIAETGGPPIRLRIAGSGPEESRLRSLIQELGVSDRVELLGDTPNEKVLGLMASCDVFALPCKVAGSGDRDGIPVVLMEAMALGRCVVSGDLETIRELIEDGQTGIMVRPGDAGEVADALVRLAADRGLARSIGRRARERIEAEFDTSVNAQRIVRAMSAHGMTGAGGPA